MIMSRFMLCCLVIMYFAVWSNVEITSLLQVVIIVAPTHLITKLLCCGTKEAIVNQLLSRWLSAHVMI